MLSLMEMGFQMDCERLESNQVEDSACPRCTVIIPVFNAAPYLGQCLDSVLDQTMADLEVICVNDGSTDESPDILRGYAAKDERIRLIEQENRGQSAARNAALKVARGVYVSFVDADDMLECNALDELSAKMDSDDLDVLYFDARAHYENDDLRSRFPVYETYYARANSHERCVTGDALFCTLREENAYRVSPCLCMTRRGHLFEQGIEFLVGSCHEDNLFTLHNMLSACRAAHVNRAYYVRRVREGSTMTSRVDPFRTVSYFRVGLGMLELVERLQLSPEAEKSALGEVTSIIGISRRYYSKRIDKDERAVVAEMLSPCERLLFDAIVLGNGDGLRRREDLESELREAKDEIERMKSSYTWRAGRVATALPRLVRRFFS